jgi:2'-5' RNA ligase
MNTLRTFVALDIPIGDELKKTWNSIIKDHIKDSIKWVDPHILHLTLFFLGETPIATIDSIKINLTNFLLDFKSFKITLKGLGVFGSKNNPRVIWVGVVPSDSLLLIYQKIVDSLKPSGFLPDERGFNPHITLGRIKNLFDVNKFIHSVNVEQNKVFQETRVDKVTLYKSDLTPKGPIYTPLHQVKI